MREEMSISVNRNRTLEGLCYGISEESINTILKDKELTHKLYQLNSQPCNFHSQKAHLLRQIVQQKDQRFQVVLKSMNSYSLMSKVGTAAPHSHSTQNSSQSQRPLTPRLKHPITPFSQENRSPTIKAHSPSRRDIENSPLQIPLSIALHRLTSNELQRRRQGDRCRTDHFEGQQNLSNPDLQNLKNILQEFAQSLYCSIERDLYSKFNCEMKRMVLKYRETGKLLERVQEIVVSHADVIEQDRNGKIRRQMHKREVNRLQEEIGRLKNQLERQRGKRDCQHRQIQLVSKENEQLRAYLRKYEDMFLRKLQETRPIHQYSMNQDKRANHSHQYQEMTASYILNINQLPPSNSPLPKNYNTHRSTLDPQRHSPNPSLLRRVRLS